MRLLARLELGRIEGSEDGREGIGLDGIALQHLPAPLLHCFYSAHQPLFARGFGLG